ncbi:MAG: hypothetical protein CMJ58_00395 [Planctomycetaceae bacterium]|nr:hypothetical protein [Planctomycetaceae bacterium]
MGLFNKQNGSETENRRNRRTPAESARVNDTVNVELWKSDDGQGRLSWGITRHNASGAPFRTFHPDHLPACVEGLAFLANVLSKAKAVHPVIGADLTALAVDLDEVVAKHKARVIPQSVKAIETNGILAA